MKTVFVDVDTQIDFLYPAGALYVPGAEDVLPNIVRLNRHAAQHGIPVISSTDAHAEDDPEFRQWPAHCVVDTIGQQKPVATLLEPRVVAPNRAGRHDISGARQIVIQKQALDCFSNVNLPAVLDQLGADRYVVYGVVTEYCVRRAASGLLKTGRRVELVTDAVKELNAEEAGKTLREFVSSGGALVSTEEVCARP
ncbi:MAG: cysteine hydrolase family protein [Acidobacteria bacterium]|nr:cysteine hydrolase family protein [Acidobacteriota bacterium]MBI3280284.1 cysteine hydrolase family protein [Acidobacteriota bacterium]